MTRDDRTAALVLWAATFLIFAAGAGRLGFYYDDGPAMTTLPQSDLRGLVSHVLNYVPGRNLHVLWQYLFLKLTANLTVLHVVQSAVGGMVVLVFLVPVSFLQPDGLFHPRRGPLLLGAPGQYSLRLGSFPATDRAMIESYEGSLHDPPRRVGRLEVSPP